MGVLVLRFKSTAFVELDVANPIGSITLWPGSIASIPAGWQLCDGTNGTPDMRDIFPLGAGFTYAPGDTGGEITHSHAVFNEDHSHEAETMVNVAGAGPEEAYEGTARTSDEGSTGVTGVANHTPEFRALAFIQRMS